MINLSKYEIDSTEEKPVSEKQHSTIKIKGKNNRNTGKRKKERTSLTGINSTLRRRLKKWDKHHLNKAKQIVIDNNLGKSDINNNLANIPRLCTNCDHCIKAVNYCGVFRNNCTTLVKKNKVCHFLKPVNR